jgi:hypothetical protein
MRVRKGGRGGGATNGEVAVGRGQGRREGAMNVEVAACGGCGLACSHDDGVVNEGDNALRLDGEGVEDANARFWNCSNKLSLPS